MRVVEAQAGHVVAMLLADRLRLTLPGRVYGLVLAQLALSDAVAFHAPADAAAPIAVAGLAPLPDNEADLWFLVRPGGLGTHALRIVRYARARLGRYPFGVVCFVDPGNANGERLARLLGFRPEATFIDGHRQWRR